MIWDGASTSVSSPRWKVTYWPAQVQVVSEPFTQSLYPFIQAHPQHL